MLESRRVSGSITRCQFGQKTPKNTTNGWKFTSNAGVSRFDILGMWFSDGRDAPASQTDIGKLDIAGTIYVKGGSNDVYDSIISEKRLGSSTGVKYRAAEFHENLHISQLKAHPDNDKVPYRQVLCTIVGGKAKYIYYEAVSKLDKTLDVGDFDEKVFFKDSTYVADSSIKWSGNVWIFYSTGEQAKSMEEAAYDLEIGILSGKK